MTKREEEGERNGKDEGEEGRKRTDEEGSPIQVQKVAYVDQTRTEHDSSSEIKFANVPF